MSDLIRLSPADLFLLWWAAEEGEPPLVLDLPRPGNTPERRAEHAAEASGRLRARGLGTVPEPAPALAAALRHLAGAGTTLDLRAYGADGPRYGFGALAGRDAAIAVRAGDEVLLGTVTPGGLAGSLLEVLAPRRAAPGWPANVSVDDYALACREGEVTGVSGFVRALRAAGLREPDAAVLARAVTTREGGGQLGATVRGTRAPVPVTWVDTPSGRYAVRRHGEWITVTPADTARLTAMAEDMLATIR